jgi:putative FmdB family regulatory protein
MPIYRYKCPGCNLVSEKLAKVADKDDQICPRCGSETRRLGADTFAVSTPLDTTKKDAYTESEIDKVVGASAHKKWEDLTKKKEKRLAGANVVDLGIKPGQTFNPEALLGDQKRKARAKEYSEAVSQAKGKETWDKKGFRKLAV